MKEGRKKNDKRSKKDSVSQNRTSSYQARLNNQFPVEKVMAIPGRVWHIDVLIRIE